MSAQPSNAALQMAIGIGIGLIPWAGMVVAVVLQVVAGYNSFYPSLVGYGFAFIAYVVTIVLATPLYQHMEQARRSGLRIIVAVNFPALLIFAWWWFRWVFSRGFSF